MIKTIDVAGIQLDNYTVREAVMGLDRDMVEQGFHTIEEVNTETLMLAGTDELVRKALMTLEHTVISDVGILDAVGVGNYQRKYEIEHHDFFYELMKRIERNRKAVYIIGDVLTRTEAVRDYLAKMYPRCEVVGMETLEDWDGDIDAVVNDINAASPDMILSVLPSPVQEHFLLENKDKFSASLWYGIGTMELTEKRKGFFQVIKKHIRTHKLEKHIHSYSDGQESV